MSSWLRKSKLAVAALYRGDHRSTSAPPTTRNTATVGSSASSSNTSGTHRAKVPLSSGSGRLLSVADSPRKPLNGRSDLFKEDGVAFALPRFEKPSNAMNKAPDDVGRSIECLRVPRLYFRMVSNRLARVAFATHRASPTAASPVTCPGRR